MININWTKEVDKVIYQMKFIEIRDKNYLMEFSALGIYELSTDSEEKGASCLVELSSDEISMCNIAPKDAFQFIKLNSEGFIPFIVEFTHRNENPDEFPRTVYPIHTLDRFLRELRKEPLDHDRDGCVINNQSSLARSIYWEKSLSDVMRHIESTFEDTKVSMLAWEEEHCWVLESEEDNDNEENIEEDKNNGI